ncbi:MAG: hypothetical protein EBX30_14045 [Betaproteobacteria bacterium]|nr:hypothetical protein [Betaproteobacteria bacterium]
MPVELARPRALERIRAQTADNLTALTLKVLLHELRIGGADLIVVAVVLGDAVYTALHSVAYSFALDIPSRFQTPG